MTAPRVGGPDHHCAYVDLYIGGQSSLSDLAARQADVLNAHARLRSGFIALLRNHLPREFSAVERSYGTRFADMDDTALLSAIGHTIESGADAGAMPVPRRGDATALADALAECDIRVPPGEDLGEWATYIRAERTRRAANSRAPTLADVLSGRAGAPPRTLAQALAARRAQSDPAPTTLVAPDAPSAGGAGPTADSTPSAPAAPAGFEPLAIEEPPPSTATSAAPAHPDPATPEPLEPHHNPDALVPLFDEPDDPEDPFGDGPELADGWGGLDDAFGVGSEPTMGDSVEQDEPGSGVPEPDQAALHEPEPLGPTPFGPAPLDSEPDGPEPDGPESDGPEPDDPGPDDPGPVVPDRPDGTTSLEPAAERDENAGGSADDGGDDSGAAAGHTAAAPPIVPVDPAGVFAASGPTAPRRLRPQPLKPELFPQSPAVRRTRRARPRAQRPASDFDVPPEALASDAVPPELLKKIASLVCVDRPIFMADLRAVADDDALSAFETHARSNFDSGFRIVAPKARYRDRGGLVIPTGALREAATEFAKSWWGECTAIYRSALLYELGVLFHTVGDTVATGTFSSEDANEVLQLRLNEPRGLVGAIVILGDALEVGGGTSEAIAERFEELMRDQLELIVILPTKDPLFEPAVAAVRELAEAKGWQPSCTVLAARSWDYAAANAANYVQVL